MAFVGENRLSQIFQLIKDTFAASDHRHTSLGSSTSTVLSVDTTYYSVAEGGGTTASGYYSHAEGVGGSATGSQAHSEGASCTASGGQSHAEGASSTASGTQSHAEGYNVTASGTQSHAEGSMTNASGDQAHTEGSSTSASGDMAHAEGQGTKASSDAQHVEGKYNVEDANGTYAHIIGGGSGSWARKNIHTVDWSGNAVYAGEVTATETVTDGNTTTTVSHNLTEKADASHSHSTATASSSGVGGSAGFMSAADKEKLNGIDAGANAYTLPTMSAIAKGGAKLGDGLSVADDKLSIGSLTKSDTGSTVTTDGCAIYGVNGEGWSEQRSTTGKNLLNIAKTPEYSNRCSVSVNGDSITLTCTTDGYMYVDLACDIEIGSNYILSRESITNGQFVIRDASHNNNITTPSSSVSTFTATETKCHVRFFLDEAVVGNTITITKPQLELGSTATAYEPYTGGAPAPSPDYPQEIKVCKGRNLFDASDANNEANMRVSNSAGNTYSASGYTASHYVPVSGGETYTLTSGHNAYSAWYTSSKQHISGSTWNNGAKRTAPANAAYLRFDMPTSNIGSSQLELGSTATPYVPYGHVGLTIAKEPELVTEQHSINGSGVEASASGHNVCSLVLSPGDYTLVYDKTTNDSQMRIHAFDSDGAWIRQITSYASIVAQHVIVPFSVSQGDAVVKFSLPREFFPSYRVVSVTPVPIPSTGLAALPDGTKDTLVIDSAGHVGGLKKSGEVTFDGSESWSVQNSGKRVRVDNSYWTNSTMPKGTTNSSGEYDQYSVYNGFSSHFPSTTPRKTYYDNEIGFAADNSGTTPSLLFNDGTGSMTAEAWAAWLTSNNVTVLYPLATQQTWDGGYIDLPELPNGATVSIPELTSIGVEWWIIGADAVVEHSKNERAYIESLVNAAIDDALGAVLNASY